MNRPAEAKLIVQLAIQRHGFFQHRASLGELFGEEEGIADPPENPCDPRFVADLAEEGQRFLEHGPGVGDRLAIDNSGKGRVVKGVGQRAFVSQLAREPDTLVVETLGDIHLALPVGQPAGGLEGSQPFLWKLTTIGQCEHVIHATTPFVQVAAHLPEPPHADRKFHRAAGIS